MISLRTAKKLTVPNYKKAGKQMKTIWANMNPDKVDMSTLARHCEGKYHLIAQAAPGNDPAAVLALAGQADAVISGLEKWDEAALSAVRGKVRFIQKYGMGLDNIDLEAAARNGILVANIIGANSAAVAEVALLHILNIGRRFVSCVNGVKDGIWPAYEEGDELDGKTVGLLGYGNISKQLVRMLSGFQVTILAYDPYVSQPAEGQPVTFVSSREELFARSDIVSLHIPCTPETAGSINADLFSRMRQGACLVNTCRGGVINEADLIKALRSGQIGAAGLDVRAQEPPAADDVLLQMPNVYITSHMGAESNESQARSQKVMCEALDTVFSGGIPVFARNAELYQKYQGEIK